MIEFGGWRSADVLRVCLAMRAADRREVFATRRGFDAHEVFADLLAMRPQTLWFDVAYDRTLMGAPVAFFGVFHRSPGVGSAVMLATDALRPMQARAVARRVRRVVIPDLIGLGLRRVDCQSLEDHRDAAAFLRWCGARATPYPRRAVGKRGEDFREHVWLADELREG